MIARNTPHGVNERMVTTTGRFVVIAIKPSGRRVVCGSYPDRAAAEGWVSLLRGFLRSIGGDALIEERLPRVNSDV
jgi:hypothetical protein